MSTVKYAIKPDNTKQIIVEATDKLGNVSTTESTILDGSGGTGGGAGGPGGTPAATSLVQLMSMRPTTGPQW
jgi:hypothetical protein